MIDENKAIRDANRGAKAEQLLSDEVLLGAFRNLEDAYIAAWRETHVTDQIGREKLFLAVNVVGKVKQNLEVIIANGRLAAEDLKDLASEAERKKLFKII